MSTEAVSYQPSEITRSEEEEKLLKDIRDQKEKLWYDIQVS